MRYLAKKITIIALCIFLLFQTGCWDQKIYEDIGFILQMGLELDKEKKLLYTVSVPVVAPDIEKKVEILSTSKNLLRESRETLRRVSGRNIEGGKTQHIYFSRELAERGTDELLEIFMRSPENPLLANVIVVDGSPKEMMEFSADFKDKPRPALYINDLLENTRQNSFIPETRVYDFLICQNAKTTDPVTPLFRYSKKEVQAAGSALFSGDRMVGELDEAETGLLHALMATKRKVQYIYKEQDTQENPNKIKKGAAILLKKIKRKVKIDIENGIPKIVIKLNLKASLDEYDEEHNLDDLESKRKLEKAVALSIKEDCTKLLEKIQKTGSDPLGFSEMIRVKHNKYWKSVQWKEIYSQVSFNVEAELMFEFYGAIS
ncbi:MAG: Ger(x)C family spore germination protein [Clostridia bacterium]|nr:Ger(x)C family spore germination protein [Clostridia bacterium]